VLAAHAGTQPLTVADVVENPYVLEFLGLEERPGYRESDLEQANTDHLQTFLVELGRGFCFEARQKRITFDNDPYFIDLVFYHCILKCHVLVALRLGAFSHANAGQMNGYLNYYREQEMTPGDNPPVGLILCAQKNDTLVHCATSGLSEQLFVRKYQVNLPTEGELQGGIWAEQERFQPQGTGIAGTCECVFRTSKSTLSTPVTPPLVWSIPFQKARSPAAPQGTTGLSFYACGLFHG